MERSFQRLEELLLKLSTDRPPVSRGVFSPDDARKIAAFAMDNYYRQFKLYPACFAPKEQLVMKQCRRAGPTGQRPQPLDEGLAVGEHRKWPRWLNCRLETPKHTQEKREEEEE